MEIVTLEIMSITKKVGRLYSNIKRIIKQKKKKDYGRMVSLLNGFD